LASPEKQAANSIKDNVGRQAMAQAAFVLSKLRTKDIKATSATKLFKYIYNQCTGLAVEWPKSVEKQTSIVELLHALQADGDMCNTDNIEELSRASQKKKRSSCSISLSTRV
jgi:hypothetical protein